MNVAAREYPLRWTAAELLQDLNLSAGAWGDLPLLGLTLDSRQVEKNWLFIALQGSQGHGLDYLQNAITAGASLVVAEVSSEWSEDNIRALQAGVPVLAVDELRARASDIAARFYNYPANAMRMTGVTGTNGKTSVSLFLAQALPENWNCAVTGTTGNGFPGSLQTATHTTPDAVAAQRLLADLKAQGAQSVVMEVSSHALDQQRLAAIPFHTAIFTNLSRDHLDYHGSMRAYASAKRRLFETPTLELAVINADDESGAEILSALKGKVKTVACHQGRHGLDADEFVRLEKLQQRSQGMLIEFSSSWGRGRIESTLLGDFNANNLMLVLAVLLAWEVPMETAVSRLEKLTTVSGRMQQFGGGEQPLVVVDYAHTPDALAKTLTSLRAHTPGKLICVFGCGGNRDIGKRAQMGRLAEALAELVILTDDNPRNEASAAILADILEGMDEPRRAQVIPDRARAIASAIALAQSDDTILVAGKGHEAWQQIGDQRVPFSDMEQVQQLLGRQI